MSVWTVENGAKFALRSEVTSIVVFIHVWDEPSHDVWQRAADRREMKFDHVLKVLLRQLCAYDHRLVPLSKGGPSQAKKAKTCWLGFAAGFPPACTVICVQMSYLMG